MAIATRAKASRKKNSVTPSRAITDLDRSGMLPDSLARVIVKRALLDERAKTLPPERAKILRASDGAVRLDKQERELWKSYCEQKAEYMLGAPVTKEGGDSRRHMLKVVTQKRLRNMLTDLATAVLEEARRGFAE